MSDAPLVWLNGTIADEGETRISPFDRGFLWGDGVYEFTSVFEGRPYRLADHLDRLYRSLAYVQIDPGCDKAALLQATEELLNSNTRAGRLGAPMYRLGHWVTRGPDSPSMAALDAGPATIMIWLRLVDCGVVARAQREGVKLVVTATRRNPPSAIEARAKVTSKMNQILAELDAAVHGGLALMLDMDGNVAEQAVANFFVVRNGVLWTPPERNILEGVTRKVVFEIAAREGISVEERLFTLYDVAQAEEYFISRSGAGITPVRQVGRFLPPSPVPGPVTRRLIEAIAADTGFDFSRFN